jgi:hypothetical protein
LCSAAEFDELAADAFGAEAVGEVAARQAPSSSRPWTRP